MATDAQILDALAGKNGVQAARFRAYQTDRLGTVLSDLSQALIPGGQIDCDNDRAVPRTLRCTFDARQLPSSFLTASAFQFNVAVHYQALIAGTWVDWPRGIYWLDHPWEEFTPGTRMWTAQGADLTYVLSLATTPSTYVVPAGSAYIPQVATIVASLGLPCGFGPDPISPARQTPVDFTWAPDTSWLTICNDLLAGVNWFPLWTDDNGIVQSRLKVNPAIDPPAIAYPQEMIMQPFKQMRGDMSKALNRLKALIDDPNRTASFVQLSNYDDTSPISITTLGYPKSAELRSSNGMKCILDIATVQDACAYALQLANCQALPAELSTFPDPRRGNQEFYTISLADNAGTIVSNQQYRVSGWSFGLNIGQTMVHKLQRADQVALTL